MVSAMTSSGYPLPKDKFLISSNSLLILLSKQILSTECETLNQVNLARLRSKSIPTQTQACGRRLSLYTSYESKRTSFNQYIQWW